MDTGKFGNVKIEGKVDYDDLNEVFQIDAVKKYDTSEIDIFTKCRNHFKSTGSSSSEIEFVDQKHDTDSYQEQNEEKLDVKYLNPKESGHSNFFDNSSSTCNTVPIKNDDIDVFYEDIKYITGEEESSERNTFCEVCSQSFGRETCRSECSCQKQNEPLFYNIPSLRDFITDSGIQPLPLQDETISGDEVTKEPDSSKLPMKIDDNMRKFYSESLENDVPVVETKFCCKICSKSFNRIDNLKVHEMIHTGEKPFHCKICSKSFRTTSHLKIHERSHADKKPFQCKICLKSFCQMSTLKDHEMVHMDEKPFQCKLCSKSYSRMGYLTIHERGHTGEKPFRCQICSKSFSRMSILIVHERTHNDEKPFHCKICSMSFRTTTHLKSHERGRHTDEKPFHCKICSKSFRTTSHLKIHERANSGNTAEKSFHCEICSKAFSRKSNLKFHERTHTGEKPLFSCRFCSKPFAHVGHLKAHERVHTGEKLFQCKICFKAFTTAGTVKVHEKIHSEKKM